MQLSEGRVTANGLTFAYLEAGSGPLALCLHGFPDSAWTWRHLLPALADAGYRAVAPFMRGYAPTDVPADGRYQTGVLGLDACELHQALGGDGDAVLIGHDWGAFAAYTAAAWQPERWRRVVTAAVPPPPSIAEAFLSYDQLHRSWYMFFFQHPLSDFVVPMDDFAYLERLWADWSPGHDAAEDLAHVKDALRDPSNLAAALGYYRATLGAGLVDPALADVQDAGNRPTPQPTLYLHGADDGCMGAEVMASAADHLPAPGSRVEVVQAAGHFMHLERPAHVNHLILDFLKG
jgi:pimeloyl-ACP methyl ester carboxylesterase